MEDARKDLFKLAGRVEALESSVRETQQRNWEALQEHQELVNERLTGLEKRTDDATSEAAEAEMQAGQRLEQLAGRVEEIGGAHPSLEKRIADLDQAVTKAVEQRLAGLEKRANKAAKARSQSGERIEKLAGRLDEIGRTQPSLEKRLADLEKSIGGAVEHRLAGLEKWADEAAAGATKAESQAGARIEKLAGRVEAVERLSERVEAVGQQVESARKLAHDVRDLHEPLVLRLTELEALEREAANGSRKLEERVAETIEGLTARTELAETIETLMTRVDALDRRLSEAEKRSARPEEPPATPTPEAAKRKLGVMSRWST